MLHQKGKSGLGGGASFPTIAISHFCTILALKREEGAEMSEKILKKVRPDAKGRIMLGIKVTEGVSSYTLIREQGRLILEPNIEIPAKEKWLWDNKSALNQVKKGLKDSARGRVKSRGSFAKFVDDEE
jgi:hypothetical protein